MSSITRSRTQEAWAARESNPEPTDYEAPMSSSDQKEAIRDLEVAHHLSMHDVTEVALERPHRLLLRVTVPARICVDFLGTRVAAKLGHGHEVKDRVDASVAAAVETMSIGFIITLA
jgi:hypothetical protein